MRPYQEEAVRETILALKDHKKVGAILPTAAGKTEIFIGVAVQFLAENPDKSVLILSHLSLLTKQTKERFHKRAPHLRVGVLQADVEPAPDVHVVVSTMQSSRDADKAKRFIERSYRKVGLIIVDECHYLTTESYETAIGHFPEARIFGVTATPFRERRLMTKYFDKISFSIAMQDLINDGYLVEPKLKQIVADNSEVESVAALVTRIYQEEEKGKKAIVFMRTIEDAKTMRNALENAGVKSHAVTSELTGEHRDEILDGFKDNDTMVLTTVNVLTAGFDAPNVSAIFMPYATESPTLYMQRIGRGLRLYPGKTHCNIYVVGKTPSISREQMETHRHALNGTKDWKEHRTLTDDLEFNLPTDPKYTWTEQILAIAERMKAIGARDVSQMLVEKRFPKKFMGSLDKLQSFMIEASKETVERADQFITARQMDAIRRYGFDAETAQGLSKYEASVILSAMKMMFASEGEFVIQSGKMAGKHVNDLPFFYKKTVLTKFPNSNVAKMIAAWEGKKYGS